MKQYMTVVLFFVAGLVLFVACPALVSARADEAVIAGILLALAVPFATWRAYQFIHKEKVQ